MIDLTSRVDTWLRLVDADDRRPVDNDDISYPSRNLNSRIVRPLEPGTYYVEASTYGARATGSYALRISVDDCKTIEIAVPYGGGKSLSPDGCHDLYDLADYADIYSFQLDVEAEVTIDLGSRAFNAFVRLLDDRGTEIEHDNDNGNGQNSRIELVLPVGAYHIVATDYSRGRGEGTYELRVAAEWAENAYSGEVHEPCEPDRHLRSSPYWKDDPLDVRSVKQLMTRVLFQIAADDDVTLCTNSDYNDFGAPRPWAGAGGYTGGHAGWDVQTTNVYEDRTANVPFYSLTEGEVVYVDSMSLGAIGVYDADEDFTVYYLHARHVYVREGQRVSVDQRLGIQGDTGVPGEEHIHIEVHRGDRTNRDEQENLRHHFGGAFNAPGRGGADTLLLWHEQLNYLCEASAGSRLRLDNGRCPSLDATDAPSPDLR